MYNSGIILHSVNRADDTITSGSDKIDSVRSDKSMNTIQKIDNTISSAIDETESFRTNKTTQEFDIGHTSYATSELLSDAGRAIINKHIDSYIKNKTFDITTLPVISINATLESTTEVSSQIVVSVEDTRGKIYVDNPS